jgi:hypothetical protein
LAGNIPAAVEPYPKHSSCGLTLTR